MPLFGPPKVEKLKAKGDVPGLIRALRDSRPGWEKADARQALLELDGVVVDAATAQVLAASLEEEADYGGKRLIDREGPSGDDLPWLGQIAEIAIHFRAVAVAQRLLRHRNKHVRVYAAGILGEMGGAVLGTDAADRLAAAREDDDHYVRRTAISASGSIGDTSAVEPLVEILQTGPHTGADGQADEVEELRLVEERRRAARALGELGGRRAVGALMEIVHADHEDPRVRTDAASALLLIGGDAEHATAAEFLASPTATNETRTTAIERWLRMWQRYNVQGRCDVCTDEKPWSTETTRPLYFGFRSRGSRFVVPADTFQDSVDHGYDPFASGRADDTKWKALDIPADLAYRDWKVQIAADPTDWLLCLGCAYDFAGFIEDQAPQLSTWECPYCDRKVELSPADGGMRPPYGGPPTAAERLAACPVHRSEV